MEKILTNSPSEDKNKKELKTSLTQKMKHYLKIGGLTTLGLLGGTNDAGIQQENQALKDSLKGYPYPIYNEDKHKLLSYDEFIQQGKWLESLEGYKELVNTIPNHIKEKEEEISKYKLMVKNGDTSQWLTQDIAKKLDDIDYLKKLLADAMKSLEDPKKSAYEDYLKDEKSTYTEYDTELNWLYQNISSPEYLEKLKGEFGDKAESILEERKKRLFDKDYGIAKGFQIDPSQNITGGFNLKTDSVEFPSAHEEGLGVHEFSHDMNRGNDLLSEKSKKLYSESYTGEFLNPDEIKQEWKYLVDYNQSYFNNPTERDARKKAFEFDMVKLGVKKSGEEFTWDHYQKMLELRKQGLVNRQSEEFLRMTKPEKIVEVMNEIAENQNHKIIGNTMYLDGSEFSA